MFAISDLNQMVNKTINTESFGISFPERKDMSDVSFVGIHNTVDGLIAFADTKASREFDDGHREEDGKRGQIQKVFKNSQFIVVTFGNNELFSSCNMQNIEDYFTEHLSTNIDYERFLRQLYNKLLLDPPEYNTGIYNFIIGAKDSEGDTFTQLVKMDILNKQISFSERDYAKKCSFGGDERYVKIFMQFPLYTNLPIETYATTLQKQLEKLVEIFDLDPKYNSVGKPIQIDIFK